MANELSKDEKKAYAEMLYMRGNMEQKDIARMVGISEQTLTKWVNDTDMGWKVKRRSFLITKKELVRRLYSIVDKITTKVDEDEEAGDTAQADKLIKYTAAIKNLETEMSVSEIMDVAMNFTKWLQALDPDLAMLVTEYFDKFIKHRLKQF